MTENISNGLELYKQFLFHYLNWVEVWLLEHPVSCFETQHEYLIAFNSANKIQLTSMQERYALDKETIELFTNPLKTNENGRECITVIGS